MPPFRIEKLLVSQQVRFSCVDKVKFAYVDKVKFSYVYPGFGMDTG